MALKPCIEKIDLPKQMKDYLISQREVNAKKGLSERESDLLAAKELQEKTLDSLHNVYNQIGIDGYDKPIKETTRKPVQQNAPEPKGSENKEAVSESTKPNGQGGAETTTTISVEEQKEKELREAEKPEGSTAKALEDASKTKPTVWEQIINFVKKAGEKLGIVSNEQHISNFEKAKAEWNKLDKKQKKIKRADYELDDLHHTEGGYYKVGNSLIDLDLNSSHLKLLLENNKFLGILNKLGVTKIHGEDRPPSEMFAHYSDNKIHLNNNSAFENIRQVTNAMSHELGHHEWTKLTKAERDYVKTLPLETGMAKHYEAQENSGNGKETSASLQEENFADYVMQYFQGSLYGDKALLDKIPTKLRELFDNKYGELLKDKTEHQEVAEQYHSDKKAGKETDLTKAVESLLKEQPIIKNKNSNIKEAVSESTKPVGQENAGAGTAVPPVKETTTTEQPESDNEYTSVRKEKLQEIKNAKDIFEKRFKKTWNETYDSALKNVQERFPQYSLYDAMRARVGELVEKLKKKELFNPTSEDIAIFNVLRNETQRRINNIEGIDSTNEVKRLAAVSEFEPLNNDLLNIARVTNPEGESGRAFAMLQSEVKLDPEYGLKIRRMQLLKAKHGDKLTPEEEKWAKEHWEKERELYQKEEKLRTDAMRQQFDDQISELKRQYEEKLKSVKPDNKKSTTSDKQTLSAKGKNIADQIRKLKKPKGSTNVDFTLGTWDLAIEGIAKLVEAGSTVAEAIEQLIKENKLGFKKETDKNNFEALLSDWLRNHKDRTDSLEKIKVAAKDQKSSMITNEMVSKNLIRDYVNGHIGEFDKSEILQKAFDELKKVLPDVSKDQLREAYLKEGDFKQPTKKQLEGSIKEQAQEIAKIAKQELTADQEQKIKLQRDKGNAIRKKKEFEKKMERGEFEDTIPVKLKKQDAELIQLKREQATIEEQYRKKQNELSGKDKSWKEFFADFVRSAVVTLMIGRPATLAKVGSMSLLRPLSETSSKLTFGKVFDLFFPNISKAAKLGGESSSLISIQAGAEAYFRQMGEKDMEKMYDKAEKEYNDSVKKYNDLKNNPDATEKELKDLKDDVNRKLLKVQGTFIYKYIGGSSIKDALTALVNRSNVIERQFGHVEGESINDGAKFDSSKNMFKEGLRGELNEFNYIMGFIGRSHSAAKTFSGRFSFAAGFMARLEGALAKGEDITSGNKIMEIAHESYLDWERGKYQQSNYISDLWNKMVNHITEGERGSERESTAKAIQKVMTTDVAITRVPVNILHEAIAEYTFGAFRALSMAYKVNKEVRKQLETEGYKDYDAQTEKFVNGKDQQEFKQAIRNSLSNMDEKQAATIVRCFRKGGLGVGLYALALISGAIHFGIFPHMGQKKEKDEDKLKKDELNPGQVMVGDTKLSEPVSAIIEHVPAFWPALMGIGMAQSYNDNLNKRVKDEDGHTHKVGSKEATAKAIYTHLKIVEGGIPQSKVISPLKVAKDIGMLIKKRFQTEKK